MILSYAVAIGLFALIVPLTVQELVNTFAFAIEPIMIVTLALIMLGALLFMGAFRVLQARAVEVLLQRLYTRIALAMTDLLPRFQDDRFTPRHANLFMEAELLPRAVVTMLSDMVNVTVSGMIGMTILVMYHPYFLAYNLLLISGFVFVVAVSGRGGFAITKTISQLNYDLFNWIQNIAANHLHFKSTDSTPMLISKTDAITRSYVMARRMRSDILTGRQYKSAVIWQAFGHSGMIGLGGYLLSIGDITLGQFVASEVIVGTLLLHLDTIARRMYALLYLFTSMEELSLLFSLPKTEAHDVSQAVLPDVARFGIRLGCRNISFQQPESAPIFEHVDLEVAPGEKISVLCQSSRTKSYLALVLAGLLRPTTGVVRYNEVDLRDVPIAFVNACRGLVLDSHPTLFDGTLEENISLHRPGVTFDQLRWALRFVELEEEIDALPKGIETPIDSKAAAFTTSQILRILLARALVTRPQILIFDGTLHDIEPDLRLTLLRRLCSKEEPWSVIFITNDPAISPLVERRVMLD